jgi:2-oxoglutarate ferredoxin oxidoreductase subunit delta
MLKTRLKGMIVIDSKRCKGCGLCVWACPTGHIKLSDTADIRGITVACTNDRHKCTGCSFCAVVCPEVAIDVYKMATAGYPRTHAS